MKRIKISRSCVCCDVGSNKLEFFNRYVVNYDGRYFCNGSILDEQTALFGFKVIDKEDFHIIFEGSNKKDLIDFLNGLSRKDLQLSWLFECIDEEVLHEKIN